MPQYILLLLLLLFSSSSTYAMGNNPWFSSGDIEVAYTDAKASTVDWDGEWWIGGDFDKLVLRSRGERTNGDLESHELQALLSHYIAPFWDTRLGLNHSFQPFTQNEIIIGVAGLAPYYVDTNISTYVNKDGDVRGEIELVYEIQLTQKLVSELYLDADWRASAEVSTNLGKGLNQFETGLIIRYEFNRHLGIFLDFYNLQITGTTKSLAQSIGEATSDTGVRLGVRVFNF